MDILLTIIFSLLTVMFMMSVWGIFWLYIKLFWQQFDNDLQTLFWYMMIMLFILVITFIWLDQFITTN